MKSFDQLLACYDWQPIPNCPGRYTATGLNRSINLSELVGDKVTETSHHSPKARDEVIVLKISGGGIISYRRRDGSYLHTLNTDDGFRRKLQDLGIDDTR